jgi:hypothetical protein
LHALAAQNSCAGACSAPVHDGVDPGRPGGCFLGRDFQTRHLRQQSDVRRRRSIRAALGRRGASGLRAALRAGGGRAAAGSSTALSRALGSLRRRALLRQRHGQLRAPIGRPRRAEAAPMLTCHDVTGSLSVLSRTGHFARPLGSSSAMSRSFSRLAVLSLSLLCALSGASAVFGLGKSKAAASGEVLVLDGASSFEEALKAHPFLVVEFYAPWCAPSRRIAAAAAVAVAVASVALACPARAPSRTPHAPRPRCGHCKKLEPEWTQAAVGLKARSALFSLDRRPHAAPAECGSGGHARKG